MESLDEKQEVNIVIPQEVIKPLEPEFGKFPHQGRNIPEDE